MDELTEYLKLFGVNGSVMAAVSLTDIELMLKVTLLSLTCLWTVIKILKLMKEG